MDYLRTLGSAAVSTLVQKSGLNLPFSLGAKVPHGDPWYTLYEATKRDDGSPVSVFEYDFSDATKRGVKPFAQNTLRKLRTTRHPDTLKFMDAIESETSILIMTERVRPLSAVLPQYANKSAREKEDWLLWGIHRVSVALAFINDQCLATHGRVTTDAIFLTPSGEWKLGGFELFSNPKEETAVLYTLGGTVSGSSSYAAPEVKKGGWSALKEGNPAAADAYALGLLLHRVFNPSHPSLPTAEPPHPPPTAAQRGLIPNSVFPSFKKLLTPNPSGRLTAKGFLDIGMADGGFFASNRLVQVCAGLDNFALAGESEKGQLLRNLKESSTSFPPEFASFKVLPSLIAALEFGGASAAAIIPLVLQFGGNVSPDDYPKLILAPIVKLYASPDRNIRLALLENLPQYVDKLDKKTVSEKIFPNIQLGFSDTVPIIREATLKSMTSLASKLTDRLLNNDLLRLLAKTQMDTEPSIRTNTCILLGKLGPTLGHNTKKKVLVPAFSRSLKDSFVHARVAGLSAFMATVDCYDAIDLASKVIPSISFTLLDSEKLVRDQAVKAMGVFLKKIEEHAATMPETAIVNNGAGAPDIVGGIASASMPGTLVTTAAGTAGSLAGWAFSSIGGMISSGEGTINQPAMDRVNSAPSALQDHIGEIKRPTFATSSPATPVAGGTSKGKSMQLGASKSSAVFSSLADQLTEEAEKEEGNPWGNEDLMDVNADEDDWSAFETAPSIPQPDLSTAPIHSPLPERKKAPITSTLPVSPAPAASTFRQATSIPKEVSVDDGWDSPPSKPQTPTPASTMSKEEKSLEMARRKEERKQRIAMLKEQKKASAKP